MAKKKGGYQKPINLDAKVRGELKKLGLNCTTSKDIISAGLWNIRCVDIGCGINHGSLLDKMPRSDNINCIIHKRYNAETVTMTKQSFYRIAQALNNKDITIKNRLT